MDAQHRISTRGDMQLYSCATFLDVQERQTQKGRVEVCNFFAG
jgi:hypothetical protein